MSVAQPKENHDERGDSNERPCKGADVIASHVQPGVERLVPQAVHRGAGHEKVERIQAGVRRARGLAIQIGNGNALAMKLLDAPPGTLPQLIHRPELDRLGRARLGAGWHEAVALSVIAERTLVRMAVKAGPSDQSKRAGSDAVRAAGADVRLNVDVLEFIVDDGARRACLLTGSRHAVL